MKKLVLVLGLLVVVSMALAAQAGGASEQRLIGTWTNVVAGSNLVLNADGTTSGWGWTHWAAVDNKLVMTRAGDTGRSYEFRISSDGRTLIISANGHPEQIWDAGWIFRRN